MRSHPVVTEQVRPRAVFASAQWDGLTEVEHLAVAGDLCLRTAPQLEDAIAAVRPDANVVVLDLTGVAFADSTAVHALLSAEAKLRQEHRRLLVVPGGPLIQRLLDITGAGDRLEYFEGAVETRTVA